jgi:ankyrin repeat protein
LCDKSSVQEVNSFLKSYKASISIDDGFTWACSHNNIEVVKELLLFHGANIHAKNGYSIKWSCINGYNDIAQFLLSDPLLIQHASAQIAFLGACEGGNTSMLEYLHINKKDKIDYHYNNDEGFKHLINASNSSLFDTDYRKSMDYLILHAGLKQFPELEKMMNDLVTLSSQVKSRSEYAKKLFDSSKLYYQLSDDLDPKTAASKKIKI